jgi:hypothetical protein
MSKVLEVPDNSVRATDRYGNDGTLKAILTPTFAGPRVRSLKRIRFLWSTPALPTSGNRPVKRVKGTKMALLPDFSGKCDSGRCGGGGSLGAALLHCERLRIMV